MITLVFSDVDGRTFRIDTADRELAARWLLDICLMLGKITLHPKATLVAADEWSQA